MNNILKGLLLIVLITGCKMKEKADLILINAKVYTVDSIFSVKSAIAIKNGVILKAGSDDQILREYTSSNIEDLKGMALYPGFYDAHCHLFGLGRTLSRVDLRGAASFEEILERLKRRYDEFMPAALAGDGWDQNLWSNKEFPDNSKLNELFPNIPVVLSRIDFHAVIVNDAAIKILGIRPGDASIPPGEAIVKGGRFTGVFLENTADRFKDVLPEPDRAESNAILMAAQRECFKHGLTSISHAGESLEIIEIMEELYNSDSLKIRTDIWLTPTDENLDRFTKPFNNGKMRVGTIKLYVDGALGSRGALLLMPYSDMPGVKGIRVISDSEFERLCSWAYDHGFQVATHCIGDGANREALKMYSKFLKEGEDRRWRIEHSQIVAPQDLHMFGKYSIVPSIQPTHATSDMLWATDRLGDRIANAYIYKQLLDENGWLPSGTDFPIEEVSPVYTFFAAVFRKNREFIPQEGFNTENALSREEALRSMTIWAAKASFDEKKKGSIETGKYADFVVLDTDIMTADERGVLGAKVVSTYLGGEKVYSLLP